MTGRATAHGEIWIADLDKRRPAVIVSRDDLRGIRTRTTVAPVTTSIRSIDSQLTLSEADGVHELSAANCDELITIPKALLVRRVGRLSGQRLEALHQVLSFALSLSR